MWSCISLKKEQHMKKPQRKHNPPEYRLYCTVYIFWLFSAHYAKKNCRSRDLVWKKDYADIPCHNKFGPSWRTGGGVGEGGGGGGEGISPGLQATAILFIGKQWSSGHDATAPPPTDGAMQHTALRPQTHSKVLVNYIPAACLARDMPLQPGTIWMQASLF